MPLRLGDGDATKSDLLGGGDPTSPDLTGSLRGGIFIGLRHARHEQALLGVTAVKQPDPILGPPETGGGDTGEGGGGGGGDTGGGGDAGGGDGGDG